MTRLGLGVQRESQVALKTRPQAYHLSSDVYIRVDCQPPQGPVRGIKVDDNCAPQKKRGVRTIRSAVIPKTAKTYTNLTSS